MYWGKSNLSLWADKAWICKRSEARLVLTVQLLRACTARQYHICCDSYVSGLLCMHDLSVWDYPRYQPAKSVCVYCVISVTLRYTRKLFVAWIWKDGRSPRDVSTLATGRIAACLHFFFFFFSLDTLIGVNVNSNTY